MASALVARSATQASKAVFTGKAQRSAPAVKRVVCRAEGENTSIKKVDRSNDQIFQNLGADQASLTYLDGTLPGDFGFDPLGLLDPVNAGGFINPEWLTYAEVMNARWAMLGAAGCIAPEILGAAGVIPSQTNVVWFQSGVIAPATTYDNYWIDPYALFFLEIILMQFAELRRLQDYRKPGSMGKQYFLGLEYAFQGSGNPAYPGGPFFNMFNLGKTPEKLQELKIKEIKNGRLAMLAVFGYGAQAVITRQGPFQNLVDHVTDPFGHNILTNFGKVFGGN